jgi:ABC-type bacteriocin/lantibiotic exporter with double-glycine peptidase domain
LQRRIIDDAIATNDQLLLVTLVIIYAGIVIAQQIIKYIYNVLRGRISERICRILRAMIIDRSKSDVEHDDDGTILAKLTGEVEPVGGFGGDAYAQLLTEGGVFLSVTAYMLYTELNLAFVALLTFLPQLLTTRFVQERINLQSAKRIDEIRTVGSDVIAARSGARSRARRALGRVRSIFNIRLVIYRLKYVLKAVLNLLDHFADLAVLAAGGYMVIVGDTEIGVVVAFLSGLAKLRSPWRTLISYFRVCSDALLRFRKLDPYGPRRFSPDARPKRGNVR